MFLMQSQLVSSSLHSLWQEAESHSLLDWGWNGATFSYRNLALRMYYSKSTAHICILQLFSDVTLFIWISLIGTGRRLTCSLEGQQYRNALQQSLLFFYSPITLTSFDFRYRKLLDMSHMDQSFLWYDYIFLELEELNFAYKYLRYCFT